MANIISIGTALPGYKHQQVDILPFMQNAYKLDDIEKRKLAFLYKHSGIESRYSVVPDFGNKDGGKTFNVDNDSVSLEERMMLYAAHAPSLSIQAIENAIEGKIDASSITHLITVSCTGLSAPGLDLEIAEAMNLPDTVFRTSVNFMGCYAAIHALKIAKMICDSSPSANVVIVTTEICTIHFQHQYTIDNAASSLLFADGSAAVLVSNTIKDERSVSLNNFFSKVSFKGKRDMSWQLSSNGFLMTLSGYVPQLIEEDIASLVNEALNNAQLKKEDITHWCIHPGGKKILDVIAKQIQLSEMDLSCSRKVLASVGNLSSATVLFVLKEILENRDTGTPLNIFGVAFGPGLTMETFLATSI